MTTLEPENIFRHSASQHDKLQLGTIADNWIITLHPSRTINMPRPSFLPSLTPHSLQQCISSSIRTSPRYDKDWEGKLPRKQFHAYAKSPKLMIFAVLIIDSEITSCSSSVRLVRQLVSRIFLIQSDSNQSCSS